jgi:hypothetical protein
MSAPRRRECAFMNSNALLEVLAVNYLMKSERRKLPETGPRMHSLTRKVHSPATGALTGATRQYRKGHDLETGIQRRGLGGYAPSHAGAARKRKPRTATIDWLRCIEQNKPASKNEVLTRNDLRHHARKRSALLRLAQVLSDLAIGTRSSTAEQGALCALLL